MSLQKYYTATGHDPYTAKQMAERFEGWLTVEMMHVITLFTAILGLLVPSLLGAGAGVCMMIGGGATIAAVVIGLIATRAYKRPMFIIGYGILAMLAGAIMVCGIRY